MKHAVNGLEADSNPGLCNSLTAHGLHAQPRNLYFCPVHSHWLCSHIAWLSWGRFIVEGTILEFFTYRQYLGRTLTYMNDCPKYVTIFISVTPPVPTTITCPYCESSVTANQPALVFPVSCFRCWLTWWPCSRCGGPFHHSAASQGRILPCDCYSILLS